MGDHDVDAAAVAGGAAQAELRVSDAERDEVIGVLREQTSAGRLTLDEFEDRLGETYRARTSGELQHVLRELPVEPPNAVAMRLSAPTDEQLHRRWRRRLRGEVVGFVMPNLVCHGIWSLGPMEYWWPGWVLAATGIGLVNTLARGFDPDAERARLVAEERQRAIAEIELRRALQRPFSPD